MAENLEYNLMNGCYDAMCQKVADRIVHHEDSTGVKKKARYCNKHFKQYIKQLNVKTDHTFSKAAVDKCDKCEDDYKEVRFNA